MSDAKNQWTKPQLIVLSRGTPEEAVLTHCKRIGPQMTGPEQEAQEGCDKGEPGNCANCQSRSGTS